MKILSTSRVRKKARGKEPEDGDKGRPSSHRTQISEAISSSGGGFKTTWNFLKSSKGEEVKKRMNQHEGIAGNRGGPSNTPAKKSPKTREK